MGGRCGETGGHVPPPQCLEANVKSLIFTIGPFQIYNLRLLVIVLPPDFMTPPAYASYVRQNSHINFYYLIDYNLYV